MYNYTYIGGLFNPNDQYQEIAFRHAINTINSNPKILPGRKLKAEVEYVLQDDSYYASMKGECEHLKIHIHITYIYIYIYIFIYFINKLL